MQHSTLSSLVLIGVMLGAAAYAQQETDAPKPAPAAPTAAQEAPAKPSGPSPDTVKKAKLDGYKAKLRRGETLFCKDQPEIGSHFSKETCIDENQLAMVLEREQLQRDQMSQHACGGNGACGGK